MTAVDSSELRVRSGAADLDIHDDAADDRRLRGADVWPDRELGGVDVAPLPPYKRDVNTIFQSYALFPHLRLVDVLIQNRRARRAAAAIA